MPPVDDHAIPSTISDYVKLEYRNVAGFVSITSVRGNNTIWCDPWITDSYGLRKQPDEIDDIKTLLGTKEGMNLKKILITHAHGDHLGDTPEMMRQCLGRSRPPRLYGDANTQAITCHFMGLVDSTYAFYKTETSFYDQELSKRLPVKQPSNRKKGYVRNLTKKTEPFQLFQQAPDRNGHGGFKLKVDWAYLKHTPLSPAFLGGAATLATDPVLRADILTLGSNTQCPTIDEWIFGLRFEICGLDDKHISQFCLVTGEAFKSDTDRDKFADSEFVFWVPQAKNIVKNWNGAGQKFHSGDPCSA